MTDNSQIKVIVGMSGGVDSSVSAYLLQQQGYQVEGLFMKNWEEDDTDEYCSAAQDLADAKAVCDKLGMKLHTINFAAEYWDNVFEHFLEEYKAGRTPNPDILCNKEIKFKAFLEFAAEELGATYIATGHYVRRDDSTGRPRLLRGLDNNKDQSYFLYTLSEAQVGQSLFPVGDLEKPEVRRIAEQLDLITAKKKDSTGICFIGERKFKDFLAKFLPAMIFIIGAAIGFATGTSWGTIGIMAPIVVQVFDYNTQPILCTIGLAAACSGGVMGAHCSPISDTTIMASAGAHCYHLNHVFTQLPYALTVAAVSFVSFILAGLIQNVFVNLLIAVALMVGTLLVIRAIVAKKHAGIFAEMAEANKALAK